MFRKNLYRIYCAIELNLLQNWKKWSMLASILLQGKNENKESENKEKQETPELIHGFFYFFPLLECKKKCL
jgi:hypothetical protein